MCTSSTTQFVGNCNVVFSPIPPLYERPTISSEKPTLFIDDNGNHESQCVYTASVSDSWREIMEKSGFALDISLYPEDEESREWNYHNDEAEWDVETQNYDSKPTCTLYYTSIAVNAGLKAKLVAQVRIYLPEQGNLEATVNEHIDKVGKVVSRRWWVATVSNHRGRFSWVPTEVDMTPSQLENNLQSDKEFSLDPASGPPKKRTRVPQTAKLMSNMVTRQPLETATSNAINRNMKSAVKAEPHIIHSVKQVIELGTVITKLNKKDPKPNLKPVVRTSPAQFLFVQADREHRDIVSVLPCSPQKEKR